MLVAAQAASPKVIKVWRTLGEIHIETSEGLTESEMTDVMNAIESIGNGILEES